MKAPVIGIDLDNTLVSYDKLFHQLALEQGLIARDLAVNKTEVRDFLRRAGKEPAWTALQGLAYGTRIREAEVFAGALDFARRASAPLGDAYRQPQDAEADRGRSGRSA
jgi:FMN phosphatase YigB (HAD superfamily)